ncbi:copper amine oxidase N-terminal domain-containing protein [Paenibacillus lycopersici]|uniref:Copper amine oxidase N-terminal domain-containing protein n=1 Tax=Paenibacillus lycopersici TaxID=2704462 RepID=A0A6C0FWG9_9BACL|nr:copper amine oxidase N-terminal domain-containing protein [Paenibacillus lycopersici]QHT59811.1 copper amine oxidase N-terminal domain-containing protein [Paenibacillus lycopersici]
MIKLTKSTTARTFCALLALGAMAAGTAAASSTASAAGSIGITMMGKPVAADSAPIYAQGRVLVPLRAVSEAMGAEVSWNQATQTASVTKWTEQMSLKIGQQVAVIERQFGEGSSKETVKLDVPLKAVHNRIYIPLRFVSEQFGYNVAWDGHTVAIRSPLSEKARTTLYGGDLAAARKLAIEAARQSNVQYEHPPLQKTYRWEMNDDEYLFPEGEALRFFVIKDSQIATYYEYRNDFLVAVWQGRLNPNDGDAVGHLLQDKLADRTGPAPKIDKAFLYYDVGFAGSASWTSSGRAGKDGKLETTAYRNDSGGVVSTKGTIALALPNETRKETVAMPR